MAKANKASLKHMEEIVRPYDLSRKAYIIMQTEDHEKQACELEKLRKEIDMLNKKLDHSRLYSRSNSISDVALGKSLRQFKATLSISSLFRIMKAKMNQT